MRQLMLNLRRGFLVTVAFFVLLGLAYPAVETGIGNLFFSHQVHGSLTANGSTRVGQQWNGPMWFQGRNDSFDPTATGGGPTVNLAPRSKQLVQDVQKRVAQLKKEGITPTNDLVTGSFSNIDPNITPADALAQVNAISKARGVPVATLKQLIAQKTHPAQFGFLGSTYINVLELNEALAQQS